MTRTRRRVLAALVCILALGEAARGQQLSLGPAVPGRIDPVTLDALGSIQLDSEAWTSNPVNITWATDTAWRSPAELTGYGIVRFTSPATIGTMRDVSSVIVLYRFACARQRFIIASLVAYSKTGVLGVESFPQPEQPLRSATSSTFVAVKVCSQAGRSLYPTT